MTIDIEASGFTLVQRRARTRDDIWNPDQTGGRMFESIQKLYAPVGVEETDLPFVELRSESVIKH